MIIYLDSVQKQCRETMENDTKNTIYRNFLSEDSHFIQKNMGETNFAQTFC